MAARKVNTPGATEKAPEPVSTAEQADAALEHITGQDAQPPQDQSTNETSSLGSLGTPVEPVEDPRIGQILVNQARIEKKLDQLLKSGGIEVKKKQRWSQGKHGLELKDI